MSGANVPLPLTGLERYAALLAESQQFQGRSLGRDAWRRMRRRPVTMISLGFLVVISLAALLTPFWPLQPPRTVQTKLKFTAPRVSTLFTDGAKWVQPDRTIDPRELDTGFGTLNPLDRVLTRARVLVFGRMELNSLCGRDSLGRDLLARLFWGARISLMVGLIAALVSLVIGVVYGAISGYFGGWIDNLMMRLVEVGYSIPFVFVVIFILTFLNNDRIRAKYLDPLHISRIGVMFIMIGAIYWLTMARVVRGQVISLKHDQFIDAARVNGASWLRIVFTHLVPNLVSVIIVLLTLTIPRIMLTEAFLSFLGLGIEAPDVSWGVLADEGMRTITPITNYWWLIVFPGFALGLTLLALNFFGDGLRDALDPRLKNRD